MKQQSIAVGLSLFALSCTHPQTEAPTKVAPPPKQEPATIAASQDPAPTTSAAKAPEPEKETEEAEPQKKMIPIKPTGPVSDLSKDDLMITLNRVGPYRLGDSPTSVAAELDEMNTFWVEAGEFRLEYLFENNVYQLCGVWTTSPKYQTKEKLGVGSTFGAFEKAYGNSYVEAATGYIYFPKKYRAYDIKVEDMPDGGTEKPSKKSKVLEIGLKTCPEIPE